jgi:hypothetical protein
MDLVGLWDGIATTAHTVEEALRARRRAPGRRFNGRGEFREVDDDKK